MKKQKCEEKRESEKRGKAELKRCTGRWERKCLTNENSSKTGENKAKKKVELMGEMIKRQISVEGREREGEEIKKHEREEEKRLKKREGGCVKMDKEKQQIERKRELKIEVK